MDGPIVACVLAGGTGTRLYPAARPDRPKPLLSFDGGPSLLARTVERVGFADERYVVTREAFADAVREHAPGAGVLIEPAARDTGPALVYAAWRLREREDDPVLVCLPSDHHVGDDAAFAETATRGARLAAETGSLVTFGVDPARPSTGYGYVVPDRDGAREADPSGEAAPDPHNEATGADPNGGAAPVEAFREKPDRETAAALIERGAYWNAGLFAWTPEALLSAARESPLSPLVSALEAGDPAAGFAAVDAASVDRAILERADDVSVVPLEVEWDDLGTWDAVGRVHGDEAGAVGDADVVTVDAPDAVVAAPGAHVTVLGLEGVVVAAFDDRILVAPREESERVREVVELLDADER